MNHLDPSPQPELPELLAAAHEWAAAVGAEFWAPTEIKYVPYLPGDWFGLCYFDPPNKRTRIEIRYLALLHTLAHEIFHGVQNAPVYKTNPCWVEPLCDFFAMSMVPAFAYRLTMMRPNWERPLTRTQAVYELPALLLMDRAKKLNWSPRTFWEFLNTPDLNLDFTLNYNMRECF